MIFIHIFLYLNLLFIVKNCLLIKIFRVPKRSYKKDFVMASQRGQLFNLSGEFLS